MGEQKPVDLDALMAEVRERIRIKREKGIYGPDVEALMRVPLPGGRRIFSEDLQDPLASLAEAIDEEVEYDPRSRKPVIGPVITYARSIRRSVQEQESRARPRIGSRDLPTAAQGTWHWRVRGGPRSAHGRAVPRERSRGARGRRANASAAGRGRKRGWPVRPAPRRAH